MIGRLPLRPAFAFLFVFAVAFYLRHFTFWLPHWQGDQSQYIILAMKIATQPNFGGYHLAETDIQLVPAEDPVGTEFAFPFLVRGKTGTVLEVYQTRGFGYYNMPFFYKAPLLPMTLALSHRYFAGIRQPFVVLKSNLGNRVLSIRPELYLKAQFWAAVVPFAASLLILTMIFFWARHEFGLRAAFYSAFIFATNPVSILTSNRIWTEDLMTVWIVLSAILFFYGTRRRAAAACFGAGVCMGFAFLTNQKSLLAAGGFVLYGFLAARAERPNERVWKTAADPRVWAFVGGVTLMSWKWMSIIYQYYGNPLWQPQTIPTNPSERDWYLVLLQRPHGLIFYPVGTAAVCWPLVFGYFSARDAWTAARRALRGVLFNRMALFGWLWAVLFLVYFLRQRAGEYRYLFPIYPALIILSGWKLAQFERWLQRWLRFPLLATGLVWIFLVAAAVYSVRAVFESLWLQRNLIHAPW